MNREILFKAKRKDNGKWVEGYLMDENYINVPFNDDDACGRFDDPIEIDPATICQYTGLTDKNGNKMLFGKLNAASSVRLKQVFQSVIQWYEAHSFGHFRQAILCGKTIMQIILHDGF